MKTGYKALIIAGAVAAAGVTFAAGTGLADERGHRGQFGISQDDDGREYRRGRGRGAAMLENFDTDGDGQLTQAEIDAVRADRFAAFDTDGNGELTLGEYAALWLDVMRERMVDRFQEHDSDGDGKVTVEEFGKRFANMVKYMESNNDGVIDENDMRRRHGRDKDDD